MSSATITMSTPALKAEFEYFLANHDRLVREYNGKFIVIKGQEVLGSYDNAIAAITETQKTHAIGTFLVQKCEPGNTAYSQTYHSRVMFA